MARILFFLSLILLSAFPAKAHFGLLIPSDNMIFSNSSAKGKLNVAFCHPFAGTGMNMDAPVELFMEANGMRVSLMDSLKAARYMDAAAFSAEYDIKRPGVYQFGLVPSPYFEKAEDCFIIHHVKTIVGAFGSEDGWEKPLGLPMEIVPLTRPFGNYRGNSFTGLVLKNGSPLADCVVEVENLNFPARHKAPNPYFETQTMRTDKNGIFTFAIPWEGWWGFAALAEGDNKLDKDGVPKNVELGGVLWTRFDSPMKLDK